VIIPFEYYNRNPEGKREQDCVCRAISTATGLEYQAVDRALEFVAENYECDKLCLCCYYHLLEKVFGYIRIDCNFEVTVNELVKLHPCEKLIIRVQSHLTCGVFGKTFDIWDCTDELVDCYWIVT
jgi:hypothetical protein